MSTSNPGNFSMIPADTASTPDADLAAAAAGAVAQPAAIVPVATPTPLPIGTSWVFDFTVGQFVDVGSSPQQTSTEFGALEQWCLMAVYCARYASAVFSDDFGMENPTGPIGELPSAELLADWRQNLMEALLVHDRVTAVQDVKLDWDPTTGILTILSMNVVTDEADPNTGEQQALTLSNVTVPIGG